jgi:hypothetical protein
MSRYVGPVRRVKVGRNHVYRDANDVRVPGVTSILSAGVPKAALINWAANATAEAAVDRWDEFGQMSPSARLKALQKARYEDRDSAANRGTEVHRFAERYIKGEEVPIPDDIAGHVESYVQFVDDWQPEPVLVEAVVMSHTHGWAGTLDGIFDFPLGLLVDAGLVPEPDDDQEPRPVRAIVDVKTSRSGIFGETALQLAAYRFCDVFMDEHGQEQPMPVVDLAFGLHVRGDGYSLLPIEAGPEQLREFRYVREVGRFAEETSRTYIGQALVSPRRMRRRRLEVVAEPEPQRTARRKEGAAR